MNKSCRVKERKRGASGKNRNNNGNDSSITCSWASEEVVNHIRSVVFGSEPGTEASEDFGNEWLNELNIEEDIDLALLDIHS